MWPHPTNFSPSIPCPNPIITLQVFNSRLVLASPETATDADYTAIEGVVAHEYFHNWTGNRWVACVRLAGEEGNCPSTK